MAQRSILSMFKKTNVQDTICRPGKLTDTLSKSRTADLTFNRLGELVQVTICRPGKPTDTLSKSRTADPTYNRLGEPVQDTICRPGNPADTLSENRTAEPTDDDILFVLVYSSEVCQQWQNLCSTIQ